MAPLRTGPLRRQSTGRQRNTRSQRGELRGKQRETACKLCPSTGHQPRHRPRKRRGVAEQRTVDGTHRTRPGIRRCSCCLQEYHARPATLPPSATLRSCQRTARRRHRTGRWSDEPVPPTRKRLQEQLLRIRNSTDHNASRTILRHGRTTRSVARGKHARH